MSGTDARTTKGKVNLRRQPSEHELGHNFEKVQELWFDDADAIFRTGSKAFRVHRSILSARSTIFADMFSVPQGTQTLAAMSTKPTIIDLPDAEMDVYFFFLAIFDASFFEPPPSSPSLEAIVSILRLSNKYDVPFLKKRSISHLEKLFPLEQDLFGIAINACLEDSESPEAIHLVSSYLEISQLSNVVDARWVFPSLFIILSQYPLSVILGCDGWKTLSDNAQAEYLLFRERYKDTMISSMSWLSMIPESGCANQVECGALAKILAIRYYHATGKRPLYSPSVAMQGLKFCSVCKVGGNGRMRNAQTERWNGYPSLLGLSGWDGVKKMKRESGY